MTLGRTEGLIKIKTDGTAGLRAVECACCNPGPCEGCPDLIDGLPGVGEPPIQPTSLAWEATLPIAPNTGCPPSQFVANSGVIERVEGQGAPCIAGVGYVKRCYVPCEEWEEWQSPDDCYGSTVYVTVLIGKYKTETYTGSHECMSSYNATRLVYDPEADCAYWLRLTAHEVYGAFGWAIFLPGFTGPILPENLIGVHSVTGSIYSGVVEIEYDEDGNEIVICLPPSFIQRSASITFS